MSLSIKTDNPNYLAKVITLPAPRPHPNANKLQVVTIDGMNVITGLEAKEGQRYIYFPLECAINKDYLAWSNSFSEASLNVDKAKKGFFPSAGRVKAVKLRGFPSEGYIIPADDLIKWLASAGERPADKDFVPGTEFSHYRDVLICEKYINLAALRKLQNAANQNRTGKVKRESRLVENQFRLHVDTLHLKKLIGNISPDDVITISEKIHGSSFILGNVLVKRPLSVVDRVAKWLGVQVVETEYDLVVSSRRVIKNQFADQKTQDFYDTDIWGAMGKRLKEFIKPGYTCYGEVFGQTPTGAWIQQSYDYGTSPLQMDYIIYRITYTSPAGDVIELTHEQYMRYCELNGLKTPPIHYHGKAKHLYPDIGTAKHWHENVLARLIKDYAEGDCKLCRNVVPREGIIVRRAAGHFEVWKLKSLRFLEAESQQLDKGEVDMETAQSVAQDTP